ncbi:hypothetical protein CPB83DRAFT_831127 [Crepidotus variabilis]|uniref:F-box domain-containing protein n=1 Tax=Crepidotus variabilis TaxID=179855 RepID=A0A9P6EUD1_9AGAR|nr:hypothetical protein CPB83DRAFT_831127 [Crepidotus variabilis]
MAALRDLPSELLGSVFEELYLLNRRVKEPDSSEMVWEFLDFRNPNLFPWVLSRICQQWAQVVAQYPHFWTRVALDISSKEPLPLGAFRWSKNHSFQALVYHSGYSKELTPSIHADEYALAYTSVERNRAHTIKEALAPHLGRCTSLEYDVLLASSLPDLPNLLQRNSMPNIQVLKLDSRTFDSRLLTVLGTRSSFKGLSLTPFRCMEAFKLPMATFISIGRLDPQLWSHSKRDRFFRLQLYHYEFCITEQEAEYQNGVASISEFLRFLPSLHVPDLQLEDLSVCPNPDSATSPTSVITTDKTTPPPINLRLIWFTIKNSSKTFLDEFFQRCLIKADFTKIENCVLPNDATVYHTDDLTLIKMPSSADLSSILTHFSGDTVRFKSCLYLNDAYLRLLSDISCEMFQYLYIKDCEGYTIQGLKNMVITMEENWEEAEADTERDGWEVVTRMATINLKGTGPKPSSEDATWFREHLETFRCN